MRRLEPRQRVLASLDRRSAELFGGLPAALDRFAAIGDCMVAVEKGLLADSLDLCLRRIGGDHLGAWVPNDADDITRWLARPIRQITTDRPDLALKLRAR
jgi:glycerophosphoryl diester phosphodiesterase